MIPEDLMRAILARYVLPRDGRHGPIHWGRVLENGLFLAERTGADVEVVRLFAVLHDSCRLTEGRDRDHGPRAAEFAGSLRGEAFQLGDGPFDLLCEACAHHTDGDTDGDITIQTCWDADRLDLGRVGFSPDPVYLCTDAARAPEVIAWAEGRSRRGHVPEIVEAEWLDLG